jgi:hypothetical protein
MSTLAGAWRLRLFTVETSDGRVRHPYGKEATGSLVMTPGGRFIAVLAAGGRKPAASEADAAALLASMIAYTGRYRVEGDQVVTDVDTLWDESWQGADRTQVRYWRLDGDILTLRTPTMRNARGTGYVATITWTREA